MQKSRSLVLLFIIGILIFPWKVLDFCVIHPLGHIHHHHTGLSPCEKRNQFKGIAFWPPMDCYKVSTHADDFQQPEKIKPAGSSFLLIAVFSEVIQVTKEEQTFTLRPDIGCNSDPPLRINALRGPPIS